MRLWRPSTVADTPSASLMLHWQAAGLHQFKAFGSNADGSGPESAVAEVTVAQGIKRKT